MEESFVNGCQTCHGIWNGSRSALQDILLDKVYSVMLIYFDVRYFLDNINYNR